MELAPQFCSVTWGKSLNLSVSSRTHCFLKAWSRTVRTWQLGRLQRPWTRVSRSSPPIPTFKFNSLLSTETCATVSTQAGGPASLFLHMSCDPAAQGPTSWSRDPVWLTAVYLGINICRCAIMTYPEREGKKNGIVALFFDHLVGVSGPNVLGSSFLLSLTELHAPVPVSLPTPALLPAPSCFPSPGLLPHPLLLSIPLVISQE